MYSPGKALVVYEMSMQVLPTAPSPTTTHLMACIFIIRGKPKRGDWNRQWISSRKKKEKKERKGKGKEREKGKKGRKMSEGLGNH